jgi:hypothetical protein
MKANEFTTEAAKSCPPATQDITLNLKNRQKAIDDYGYGPLNPDLPNTKFWMAKVDEWNLDSVDEAKSSLCGNCAAFDQRQDTLACIAQGIGSDAGAEDPTIEAGDLGYCRFLKFKCASRRTCDAWVTGGPLVDREPVDENLHDWFGKEKWVRMDTKGNIKGPCAREPGEGKPKCLPQSKAHALGKKGRASAAQKKRREDPNPNRRGPAHNVATKVQEGQQLSVQQLAQISDAALDAAYGYGRSNPGNTFGWQANLKSAAFAKQMIDRGVTDIEAISDAIHKGWNVTAQAFVKDPQMFDDSKTMAPEKLQAKIAQRQKLMTQQYAQLPEDEKEKDRVVARAMLQAITGQLDEKWSQKYKSSINCAHPKGFSQKAHCAGKRKHNESIEQEMTCPDCGMCETHGDLSRDTIDEACWKGYHKEGMKTMFGKRYPNCVKNESEEGVAESHESCPECGGAMYPDTMITEKQDACYYKVKSRYKVWPSAYASGALVQCRKKGAANWGNKSKNESVENTMDELSRIVELSTGLSLEARAELVEEFDLIESIIEDIAKHNGVDSEVIWEDLESLDDDELYVFATTTTIMETEAWQKANNRDRTDGMSRKAVKTYRREHPGSKLQTAVTTKPSKLKKGSKASKRRKSYCSRSRGQMKMHNISCAKTPDKAICKARRRWNC